MYNYRSLKQHTYIFLFTYFCLILSLLLSFHFSTPVHQEHSNSSTKNRFMWCHNQSTQQHNVYKKISAVSVNLCFLCRSTTTYKYHLVWLFCVSTGRQTHGCPYFNIQSQWWDHNKDGSRNKRPSHREHPMATSSTASRSSKACKREEARWRWDIVVASVVGP